MCAASSVSEREGQMWHLQKKGRRWKEEERSGEKTRQWQIKEEDGVREDGRKQGERRAKGSDRHNET